MPSISSGGISKIFHRFRRSQSGSAAIEFAMVAAPFFLMLLAIFEFALMFFAGQVLETATQDAARLIFTNQAQAQGFKADDFKKAVCGKVALLFDCQNSLEVDVGVFSQFSAIPNDALAAPIDSSKHLKTNLSYSNPAPGSTVIVRAFYKWPIFLSIGGFSLANLAGGNNDSDRFNLLTAVAAFRVEPGG
ncbi:Flp pilus assembly protein TadG [Nitrobacteraceae bacterium AZCC 1564]